MQYILTVLIVLVLVIQEVRLRKLNKKNLTLAIKENEDLKQLRDLSLDVVNLQDELGGEREKNRVLLSQKKSSETRLGQISEHLIPFLDNCPYNPKDLHFLGNPIDYLVFDFDEGKITFLEVKSGNSKPSKRQKIIKNMIKCGRVFYDEIRVNEKGIKLKKSQNNYTEGSVDEVNEDEKNQSSRRTDGQD
jgi:predicted Holliday junction resolvase-like endonuclease